MHSPLRLFAHAALLACLLGSGAWVCAATNDATQKKVTQKKAGNKKVANKKLANQSPEPRNVTLNFVDAEIGSVVKAMSDMTGKTILVDPRVKGTLQVTSPQPVSAKTAYETLLAAMRMQGYAAVEMDGVVRILPEADAKFYAPHFAGKRKNTLRGEMETRVFSLQHESATQLLQALRPQAGASSTMNADAVSNTLVVTDYVSNLDRLAQIIENLDAQSADEPVLIPLKHAHAQDVALLINKVYRTAQHAGAGGNGNANGGATAPGMESERLDVAVDVRSNSLILRSRNRSLISRVQNTIAALDKETPVAGNVHVVYLKNAEAVKVAETLRRIMAVDTSPAQAPAAANGARPAAGGPAVPADSGAGMIQADAASNSLIITASEAVFNNIKAVIEKLDMRRAQVLVEALIAEVSAEKATELGIQWFDASGAATSNSSEAKFFGGFGSTGPNNIASVAVNPLGAAKGLNLGVVKGQLTLPGGITIMNLGVLARALQVQADANILSTPTLMMLDNEEAKISVGTNVPFSTGQYNVTGTATPFQTIERKDIGLTLKVKPQISEGGTVRLQIYQEVSKLRSGTDNVTLATTDKRSIESMVLVDDGQIVVLGGLIEDQVQNIEDKVPLLGDVPVLGHLFRYNTRKIGKTNLMVFLRPQVVRDSKSAAAVTHPRYDYIVGQQQATATEFKPTLPDANAAILHSPNTAINGVPAVK
jgi:general secretion pathway protein D